MFTLLGGDGCQISEPLPAPAVCRLSSENALAAGVSASRHVIARARAARTVPGSIDYVPSASDYEISDNSWRDRAWPSDAAPLSERSGGFQDVREGLFPEQQKLQLHSPLDAMLTVSISRESDGQAVLSIQGGAAGALWTFVENRRMAERVGFEPTVSVNPRRFSRPLP